MYERGLRELSTIARQEQLEYADKTREVIDALGGRRGVL